MQYRSNAQIPHMNGAFSARLRMVAVLLCTLLAASLLIFATPGTAQAKSYSMTKVAIDAEVMTNGDLHVVEKRTFDFDGSFSCVWWNFEASDVSDEDVHGYQVNSVKLTEGSSGSASTRTLDEVAFKTRWRDAGGPGSSAWSYDRDETSLYVFFSAYDERMTVTIDYTVKEAAIAYEDVGEIYWKYVGSGWGEDSRNVTCTIHTPVPAGTKVTAGDNLRAWGHGPLSGSVDISTNGTVTYKVDRIASGHYGEARIVFPVSWLTKLPASAKTAHGDELGLESILAEEKNWADAANAQRVGMLVLAIAFVVLSLLLIAWSLFNFFRYGRELKPEFADRYWRDVPDKDLHPAVVGRCWRFGKESPDDLTATLMHLSAKGAIAINRGSYEAKGRFGKMKNVEELYLTRVPHVAATLEDDLDKKAMNLVFRKVSGGKQSLWMSEFGRYAKKHPETMAKEVEQWQGLLTSRVIQAKLFEPKGPKRQAAMTVGSIIYAAVGFIVVVVTENLLPLIAIIPTALIMLVLARFMGRRTRYGAETQARSEALRNWFKDFTQLKEQPPTGVKVWGEFLVYAYLFGVADQVIKQLQDHMSDIFKEDAMVVDGYGYTPFYWYTGMGHASVAPASSIFETAVNNSVEAWQAMQSSSSSGGGGGGGFSGGGGGGFGGGGGAR